MKRENAILRWLLYLAVFGFVVALTLPLFGPGVSYAEAAKVAFPCGFFTLTLYGYLVRQGEMQLWVPSLGFVVGAIGVSGVRSYQEAQIAKAGLEALYD